MNLLPQHFGRIVWSRHRTVRCHEPQSSADTTQPQPDTTMRRDPARSATTSRADRRRLRATPSPGPGRQIGAAIRRSSSLPNHLHDARSATVARVRARGDRPTRLERLQAPGQACRRRRTLRGIRRPSQRERRRADSRVLRSRRVVASGWADRVTRRSAPRRLGPRDRGSTPGSPTLHPSPAGPVPHVPVLPASGRSARRAGDGWGVQVRGSHRRQGGTQRSRIHSARLATVAHLTVACGRFDVPAIAPTLP